eukprot:CAMPEP_0184326150 /NCGR_PEP_ID=MMETSP1049-20130417/142410_1 /TAXON_ID=77928 /ORGANISM="Proteomonas sulcata, Strain CCMP704" /LENGTH=365 /DNA_ID=CAMNT_0026648325 /DNA_START=62 /DNA_END=1159 /DNA_ORIENTATION=-
MSSAEMHVFLRSVEGRTRQLRLRAEDGVKELRRKATKGLKRRGTRTRLLFGGFQLEGAKRLKEYGVKDGSTVLEVPCLSGGGGDGGTTAQQRKYMRQATVTEKATIHDETEKQRAKFHMCAASGHPLLEKDIVFCDLGFLYNKEAVLKQIALKSLHPTLKHLRKLKDLYNLKPSENPDYDPADGVTNILQAKNEYRFVCPVTGRPANGKNNFVAIKKCGCMLEVPCLSGGGGDGGTTAQQRKYMRQATVTEKATIHDETEKQRAKFHMCAASGHPLLEKDIVFCDLGFLYNKEAVLKQIALKSLHPTLKHLRKLKDLYNLKPSENPDYDPADGVTNILQAKNEYRFVCPVTGRPANGKNNFVAKL